MRPHGSSSCCMLYAHCITSQVICPVVSHFCLPSLDSQTWIYLPINKRGDLLVSNNTDLGFMQHYLSPTNLTIIVSLLWAM
jgi:hypothetical protein